MAGLSTDGDAENLTGQVVPGESFRVRPPLPRFPVVSPQTPRPVWRERRFFSRIASVVRNCQPQPAFRSEGSHSHAHALVPALPRTSHLAIG